MGFFQVHKNKKTRCWHCPVNVWSLSGEIWVIFIGYTSTVNSYLLYFYAFFEKSFNLKHSHFSATFSRYYLAFFTATPYITEPVLLNHTWYQLETGCDGDEKNKNTNWFLLYYVSNVWNNPALDHRNLLSNAHHCILNWTSKFKYFQSRNHFELVLTEKPTFAKHFLFHNSQFQTSFSMNAGTITCASKTALFSSAVYFLENSESFWNNSTCVGLVLTKKTRSWTWNRGSTQEESWSTVLFKHCPFFLFYVIHTC